MALHRKGLLFASALLAAACSLPTKTTPTPQTGLAGLTLTPSSVVAGAGTQGVVMLVAAAPAPGASVTLSSNAGWMTVPSVVTVPTGATSATFNVTTTGIEVAAVAMITASYSNTQVTTTLTVTPAPKTVANLAISPASVTGGNASQGTITLSAVAPAGGATVALSSSNPSAALVPSTVSIPAGATTGSFAIATFSVTSAADVTIAASYGGASKTANVLVMPQTALLMSLALSPATVAGGQAAQGTVTLSTPAAPGGGAFVSLSSSAAAVNVPSVVIVTAGATTAAFTITTSTVSTATDVLIAASFGGATRTATLHVTP